MISFLRRGLVTGLAVCALLVGATYPMAVAVAQGITPVAEPAGSVSLVPVINAFLPYAVELFMTAMFALAGVAVAFMKQKFNVDIEAKKKEIEAKYRESLHSAIYTGVAGVIAKGGLGDKLQVSVGSEEMASILRHVMRSVPDAINFLKPTDQVIAKIATAKAVELIAGRAGLGTVLDFIPAMVAPAGYESQS